MCEIIDHLEGARASRLDGDRIGKILKITCGREESWKRFPLLFLLIPRGFCSVVMWSLRRTLFVVTTVLPVTGSAQWCSFWGSQPLQGLHEYCGLFKVAGINIKELETWSTAFTSCDDDTKRSLVSSEIPFPFHLCATSDQSFLLEFFELQTQSLQCRTGWKKSKIYLESLKHNKILNTQKLEALMHLGKMSGLPEKNPRTTLKEPQNSQQTKHRRK